MFVNPASLDTISKVDVQAVTGIPTHRAVDATIKFNNNGPETKALQMPTHAAELFDEAVAAELKLSSEANTNVTEEDLVAEIEDISTTISTIQAVLARTELNRSKQREEFAEEEYELAVAAAANDGANEDLAADIED